MPTLFLLLHGNRATAAMMDFWADALRERFPGAECLQSTSNERLRTHDGLRAMAARLVAEVAAWLPDADPPQAPHDLCIVGHSLGGLIARAALPQLLADHPGLIPCAFITLQTPHLGSRRPEGEDLLDRFWQAGAHAALELNGLTGQELLLEDPDQMLHQLSDPEGPYIAALRRFRSCTFVAIPFGDWLVPFPSASTLPTNPYLPPGPSHPPWGIAGHRGFTGCAAALLDSKMPLPVTDPFRARCCCGPIPDTSGPLYAPTRRKAPPVMASSARTPTPCPSCVPLAKPPYPVPPSRFACDPAMQVEYCDLMAANLAAALPALRHVHPQFSDEWRRVGVHKLPVLAAPYPEARAFVALLLDLLALDFLPPPPAHRAQE